MSKPLRPLITQRLGDHHLNPALLERHLAMIGRHKGSCDEVWFATDYGMPPLAVHIDHARQMEKAADRVREAGITASLQISNTIGHSSSHLALDFTTLTWQHMVGPDGVVAPTCSCPRDPAFHAYLDAFTRAYCAWKPARVWIDDDLRMYSHRPVSCGCFCDSCLAAFSAKTGETWQRETLVNALNEGNDVPTRQAWITFLREGVATVASTVGRAAAAVAPGCIVGLQHCDITSRGYDGTDWHHVFAALEQATGRPAASRPGGGFYNDHRPREMLQKAVLIGLQSSQLPARIDLTVYECESLPAGVIGKSAQATAAECSLALAYGCNSLSFTTLQYPHETVWHDAFLAKLAAWRPFWKRYVAANRGTRNAGIEILASHNHEQRQVKPGDPPMAWTGTGYGKLDIAALIGLPLCWESSAPVSWLSGPSAQTVSVEDLRQRMTRGLIVNGEAVEVLSQHGLAHELGLRALPLSETFDMLRLTRDEINTPYLDDTVLCCTRAFGKAYTCEPIGGTCRILSHYVRVNGQPAGAEAMAIERADGGRLVVFGWGVDHAAMPSSRRHQILAAANWAAHGQLAAWLETPCQAVVIPRCDASGRVVTVLVLNVSLDPTPELMLSIPLPAEGGRWTWQRPTHKALAVGSGTRFSLPVLAPWSVGVLIHDRAKQSQKTNDKTGWNSLPQA